MLEFVIDPYANGMQEAAAAGDNGSAFQRSFVNFGSDIECGEGCLVGFKIREEKPPFVFGKDSMPFFEPSPKKLSDVDGMLLCLAFRETLVGV